MGGRRLAAIAGQEFGRLVVTVPFVDVSAGGHRRAEVRCGCGTVRLYNIAKLLSGAVVSCGCYRKERIAAQGRANKTHGKDGTPEHRTWTSMVYRCHNPRAAGYHNYGGRGIRVCDEWRESFDEFLKHIGPRPSAKYSIDRINNDGNYEPGNVRWATRTEQSRNRRTNRLVTVGARTMTIIEWSKETGLSNALICQRLGLGWPPEEAVSLQPLSREKCRQHGRNRTLGRLQEAN
jgi:hypothetical protein